MKQKTPKTAVFSLTCKADQEKKSCGFQRFIIKWKRDCFISAVKSQWENIKNSSCPLEDKLESGLYCELTDKTLHDGYIEYTLLYDMIANRISIDEVIAENGGLRLMKKSGVGI